MLTTTPPTSLSPDLESQLLEALITSPPPPPTPDIAHPTSPPALASRFNLSLSSVLDFLTNPITRSRLTAAAALTDLTLHQRTQQVQLKALTTLELLLDTTEDPIEKRRAATTLLRGPSRSTPAVASRSFPKPELADDADHEQDEHPEPPRRPAPPRPHAQLKPQDIVQTCIERLQDNDNPYTNSGLTTIHNFTDLGSVNSNSRIALLDKYLSNPGQDSFLINATTALIHPPEPSRSLPENYNDRYIPPSSRFAQRVTLSFADSSSHSATFHLRLITKYPQLQPLWHIARIEHHHSPLIDGDGDGDDHDNNSNSDRHIDELPDQHDHDNQPATRGFDETPDSS